MSQESDAGGRAQRVVNMGHMQISDGYMREATVGWAGSLGVAPQRRAAYIVRLWSAVSSSGIYVGNSDRSKE